MRLLPAQLAEHLKQGLKPLYALVGDEPLSQREALDALRAAAKTQGYEERTSLLAERYFDWQEVQNYGQAMSLFASLRLLELRIPSGKPGVDGSACLQALCQQPLPDTVTVVILPEIEWRDQKSAWYTALQQAAVFVPLMQPAPAELPNWIGQRLARQQQSTDADTLDFLAHQVEGNLLAAHQEIEKLGLLYPAGSLSADAVREAVLNVSRFDATQLGEAVLTGDLPRTVRILQGLQEEGETAVAVMNPLIWALKPLLRVKLAEAAGTPQATALRDAKLFGTRETLARQGLRRLSLRQLQAAIGKLAEIDKIAKGIQTGDAWLEISRLCFGLARVRGQSV